MADSNSSREVVGACRFEGPLLGRMAKLNLVLMTGLLWFGTPLISAEEASFPLGRAVRFLLA